MTLGCIYVWKVRARHLLRQVGNPLGCRRSDSAVGFVCGARNSFGTRLPVAHSAGCSHLFVAVTCRFWNRRISVTLLWMHQGLTSPRWRSQCGNCSVVKASLSMDQKSVAATCQAWKNTLECLSNQGNNELTTWRAVVPNPLVELKGMSSHLLMGLRGRHFQFIRLALMQSVVCAGLRRWSKYLRKRTSGSKVMPRGSLGVFSSFPRTRNHCFRKRHAEYFLCVLSSLFGTLHSLYPRQPPFGG